jgi:uncharacterized protein
MPNFRREDRFRLCGWAVARPRTTLVVLACVLALAAPGMLRLELETDGRALVAPDDPVLAVDAEARRDFGLSDPLVVMLESDDPHGVVNADTLGRLERLTAELAALPGIGAERVTSLATEKRPDLNFARSSFPGLLEPLPTTDHRRAELLRDLRDLDLLEGTLVSADRRAAAVLLGVPSSAELAEHGLDRRGLYRRVRALAERYEGAGHRITVAGAPAAEALLGDHILADLALLVPLSMVAIALLLWAATGRKVGLAALGLAKVGAVLVATFGIMGWLGQPVRLTTAMLPVVLATIALAEEIHLLWRYRRRRTELPPREAWLATERELVRPVVMTALTTVAGFLAFVVSPIAPVASFGLFTALGVLLSLLWALAVTPAMLVLAPQLVAPSAAGEAATPAWLERALGLAVRPARLLPWVAGVTVLLVAGLPRLTIQDSWVGNFNPDSELARGFERVDSRLAGSHVLRVLVAFDPPRDRPMPATPIARGPLLSGVALEALGRFERGLAARPEVGKVLGLAGQVETTAFLWGFRHPESRQILDIPGWIYLHIRRIATARGEARVRELVSRDYARTVVTLLLPRANYRSTRALMAAAEQLAARELAPVGGHIRFAGDVAVSQAMIPAIARTQILSLWLAFLPNWLAASLFFRSPVRGLLAVVPSLVAVAWVLGLMGWFGMPIGVATSMFCAVILGIGVDYGIHLLNHAGAGVGPAQAVAEVGPAIVLDAAATALGFGLLVFSQVPTNHRLGIIVALGLASVAWLTVAGLGSALARWPGLLRPGQRAADPSASTCAKGMEPAALFSPGDLPCTSESQPASPFSPSRPYQPRP